MTTSDKSIVKMILNIENWKFLLGIEEWKKNDGSIHSDSIEYLNHLEYNEVKCNLQKKGRTQIIPPFPYDIIPKRWKMLGQNIFRFGKHFTQY